MFILGYIGLVLSVIGIWLNGNKDIRCWCVWCVSNIFWVFSFADPLNVPGILLNVIFFIANLRGWRAWLKPRRVVYPEIKAVHADKLRRSKTVY